MICDLFRREQVGTFDVSRRGGANTVVASWKKDKQPAEHAAPHAEIVARVQDHRKGRERKVGEPAGVRTLDLLIKSQLLYRLS